MKNKVYAVSAFLESAALQGLLVAVALGFIWDQGSLSRALSAASVCSLAVSWLLDGAVWLSESVPLTRHELKNAESGEWVEVPSDTLRSRYDH